MPTMPLGERHGELPAADRARPGCVPTLPHGPSFHEDGHASRAGRRRNPRQRYPRAPVSSCPGAEPALMAMLDTLQPRATPHNGCRSFAQRSTVNWAPSGANVVMLEVWWPTVSTRTLLGRGRLPESMKLALTGIHPGTSRRRLWLPRGITYPRSHGAPPLAPCG